MTAIIGTLLSFALQALALKLALGAVGTSRSRNELSTAFVVSLSLNAALLFLGFLPIIGALAYLALWVVVIMKVYRIGFLKSLGVGILQFVIRGLLGLALWLVGWMASFGEAVVMTPF